MYVPDSSPDKESSHDGTDEDTMSRCSPKSFGRSTVRVFFINKEFTKILFSSLIPALNSLIPLFYAGQIPNESALAIVSQYMFVSIVLEVLQEAVVNSLFYLVGRDYEERRSEALHTLKICVAILFLLGCLLCGAVVGFTSQLVAVVNTPADIVDATKRYLYVSSFSFPLVLTNAAIQAQVLISNHILTVTSSVVAVVSTTLLNVFLFGAQTASAHWNVQQLGAYKIIAASTSLFINVLFFLLIEKITPFHFFFRVPFFTGIKQKLYSIYAVSWGNFGDSFVRNFFYFTVTLNFINHLGSSEIAAWNLLNAIMWSLLLIPSYALANHVKISVGKAATRSDLAFRVKKIAWETARAMTAWLLVVGVVSGCCWSLLAEFFSPNNQTVQELSLTMFSHVGWVFIVFTVSNTLSGFFLGTGKTRYIFYISLISNMVVYFPPWVLYLTSVLEPTYWVVIGLYIGAMLFTLCITVYYCRKVWKDINNVANVQE